MDLATKAVSKARAEEALIHVMSLATQGVLIKTVRETISAAAISKWSNNVEQLSAVLFKFVRKALQNQLATSSNLARWAEQTMLYVHSATSCRQINMFSQIVARLLRWIAIKPDMTIFSEF